MSGNDQSSAGDKTHEATPQKLRKSREKGEVPYSNEVTAAITYAAFFVALLTVFGWIFPRLSNALTLFLREPEKIAQLLTSPTDNNLATEFTSHITITILPLFSILAVAAICSVTVQRAFTFAPSKIKPKLSRLSIISNAKQKYGPNGLSEFLKSAAKLSAVLGILLVAFKNRFLAYPFLSGLPVQSILPAFQKEAVFFCGLVTAAAMLIASIDLPWRHFQHRNRLKMTYKELKDENKESEGDPALKSARRQRAESIATNRMMKDVPKADIIIVNPTHYSVALSWDRENGAAPICVAKGVDEIAARIREIAATAGIPIKRDPPTARSIYSLVDIGREIRKEHYAAVAAAIHYADNMRKKIKPDHQYE